MAARAEMAVFAHDADPGRMRDLPGRAARAGARIETVTLADARAHAPFDLVLCDVPCSGSGAWRRAPDAKWRLAPDRLAELHDQQDAILDQAARWWPRTGRSPTPPARCFGSENAARVAAFVARHPGWQAGFQRQWLPGPSGDGFFTAHIRRHEH